MDQFHPGQVGDDDNEDEDDDDDEEEDGEATFACLFAAKQKAFLRTKSA